MTRLDPTRPSVEEVLPAVRALYAREGGGAGCCLHVLLDDGNTDHASAEFVVKEALETGHEDCIDLARKLRRMSKTQRAKVVSLKYTKASDAGS